MEHKPYGPYEAYIKRPLDFCLSLGALIVFSPVMVLTAILVRTKLGTPVLFTQERPGKNEEIFKLYKFRSMTDKRDSDGNLLPDDQRLTDFGKKLRSSSIDELPELINIIKGDMAVIGPRPLLVEYLPFYTKEEKHRHDVRPGLSGLSQINGRNHLDWDSRLKMDIAYAEHITFFGDFSIVIKTILKVIKRADVSEKRITPLDEERKL